MFSTLKSLFCWDEIWRDENKDKKKRDSQQFSKDSHRNTHRKNRKEETKQSFIQNNLILSKYSCILMSLLINDALYKIYKT